MIKGVFVMAIVVALGGCDFSFVLGIEEEETLSGDAEIESYVLRVSDNPELSEDEVGFVSGTDIILELDFSIINNNIPLTPTIRVSDGATYLPKGDRTFSAPTFYEVTAEDGARRVFRVEAVIDPDSL
jgi:hypothetical protein